MLGLEQAIEFINDDELVENHAEGHPPPEARPGGQPAAKRDREETVESKSRK
jgi:hypothetical protein